MELDNDTTLVEDNIINMRLRSSPSSDDAIDEVADTTMDRPAKRQRRQAPKPEKPIKSNFVRSSVVTDDLHDDLIDFGFSKEKVKAMIAQPQPIWDPWKKDSLELELQTEVLAERERQATKRKRALEKAREPLFFKKGSGWMLFDPEIHSYPTQYSVDVPAVFRKLERFEPGNKRIVEIHRESSNVRLRSTPKELSGKRIDYGRTGPKIIDDAKAQSTEVLAAQTQGGEVESVRVESAVVQNAQTQGARTQDAQTLNVRAQDASKETAHVKATATDTAQVETTRAETAEAETPVDSPTAQPQPPAKRRPGRPRKNPVAESKDFPRETNKTQSESPPKAVKKKVSAPAEVETPRRRSSRVTRNSVRKQGSEDSQTDEGSQ